VTEREERVLTLAIEWRMSRYAIAEALSEADFKLAIDALVKERREAENERKGSPG
jgi:hypothetical protein